MCWIIQVITRDYHSAAWICEWSYLRKNIRIENEVSHETLFCCGGYVLDMKRVGQKGIAGKRRGGRLMQRAAKLQRSRNCCALCLASYNLHLKLVAHWHFFGGAVKFWQTTFNGVGLQFFGVLFCVQQGCGVHPVLTKNLEHKASKRREVAVTWCKAAQPRLIFDIIRAHRQTCEGWL